MKIISHWDPQPCCEAHADIERLFSSRQLRLQERSRVIYSFKIFTTKYIVINHYRWSAYKGTRLFRGCSQMNFCVRVEKRVTAL